MDSGAMRFTVTVPVTAISGQQVKFLNHPDAGVSADDVGPEAHRYPEQHVLARKRNLRFFHRRPLDDEFWRLDAKIFRGKDRVERRRRQSPQQFLHPYPAIPQNLDRLTESMPVTKMIRKVIDPKTASHPHGPPRARPARQRDRVVERAAPTRWIFDRRSGGHNCSGGVHREINTLQELITSRADVARKHEEPKQMSRKILSISAVAALLCFTSFAAQAAEGCGRGEHRGPDGRCYQNGGAVVVAPGGAVVVGAPVGVVCGPGLRWHPGRRRCWAY